MKRILAIVWKDFLRVRWYVAAWMALASLELGLGANQLFGHRGSFKSLSDVIATIHIAEYVLTFAIAGLLVQTDPGIGTRAFWATRPISPLRLCLAKFAGAFVVTVAIPLLVYSMWWLALRFTARDFGWAALEIAAYQCLTALPAMMVAAFTDTFTRFVVWSLVFAVMVVTGPVVWTGLEVFQLTRLAGAAIFPVFVLVFVAMFAAIIAIVAAVQICFRRAFTSIALLITGSFGVAYIGVNWPRSFIWSDESFQPGPQTKGEIGRDITLELKSAKIDNRFRSKSTRRTEIDIDFDIHGVGEQFLIASGHVSQRLDWPSGVKTNANMRFVPQWNSRALRSALGLRDPTPDPETEHWWSTLFAEVNAQRQAHGYPPLTRGNANQLSRAEMVLPTGMADLIPKLHPAYRLDVELRMLRPHIVIELPITVGSRIARDGVAFHVLAAARRDERRDQRSGERERTKLPTNAIQITATYGVPALLYDQLVRLVQRVDESWRFTLIDRATGDLTGSYRYRDPSVTVGLVSIALATDEFPELVLRRGDKWVPRDPQFVDHASLIYVKYDEVARVRRQVFVEHLDPEILPPQYPYESK